MKSVFIDTNVVLDVLLQNEPYWADSLKIFQLAEMKSIRAYVSASSITDIFYVTRKRLSPAAAHDAIEKLLSLFEVVAVDVHALHGALAMPIEDMEDALQAWCANKINAEALITRDINGFPNIDVPVVSPSKYVRQDN